MAASQEITRPPTPISQCPLTAGRYAAVSLA